MYYLTVIIMRCTNYLVITTLILSLALVSAQNEISAPGDARAPELIESFVKALFKIDQQITISSAIIFLLIWVVIIWVLRDILELVPLFEGNLILWLAAIVISILLAISGGIRDGVYFLLSLVESFVPAMGLLIVLVIVIVIGIVIIYLISLVAKKAGIEQSELKGRKIGSYLRYLKDRFS